MCAKYFVISEKNLAPSAASTIAEQTQPRYAHSGECNSVSNGFDAILAGRKPMPQCHGAGVTRIDIRTEPVNQTGLTFGQHTAIFALCGCKATGPACPLRLQFPSPCRPPEPVRVHIS
jgi:hypothetical protein